MTSRFWLSCTDLEKKKLREITLAFQNAQYGNKVKTFLTHFCLKKPSPKCFFESIGSVKQAGSHQRQSRSGVIALLFLHSEHLRTQLDTWDGVLWEKVHCRRGWMMRCRPQQGGLPHNHVCISKEATVSPAPACRPQWERYFKKFCFHLFLLHLFIKNACGLR